MLRLAATQSDHWNVQRPLRQPADAAPLRAAGDAARAVGRAPATLGRSASILVDLSGAHGQRGQPEQLAETLRAYAREGLAHVPVWLSPPARSRASSRSRPRSGCSTAREGVANDARAAHRRARRWAPSSSSNALE